MARLLLRALGEAGFAPEIASRLRTHDAKGDSAFQERARRDSIAEADRLIAHYRGLAEHQRPVLWFTYHVYYKAPDWIGPRVADALGIPYVVAEGSRAPKRAEGAWCAGHRAAEQALDGAALDFHHDRKGQAGARSGTARAAAIGRSSAVHRRDGMGSPARAHAASKWCPAC